MGSEMCIRDRWTDVYGGSSHKATIHAARSFCALFVVRQKKTRSRHKSPKKSRRCSHPKGASCVVALRGPAPRLAPGTLRAPVSVGGTLTKSEGRPHRRSRWDWTPRSKTAVHPKQKAALGRPFALARVAAVSGRQPQRPEAERGAAYVATLSTNRSWPA